MKDSYLYRGRLLEREPRSTNTWTHVGGDGDERETLELWKATSSTDKPYAVSLEVDRLSDGRGPTILYMEADCGATPEAAFAAFDAALAAVARAFPASDARLESERTRGA